jgi:hypothetical protein
MANCGICNVDVGFFNSPNFGMGKLSDGTEACLDCFRKISKKDVKIGNNLKKQTKESIIEFLALSDIAVDEATKKLNDIKAKIKSLGMDGFSAFLGRKEINKLPEIMIEGEEFEHIIQGMYKEKQGVLVATNLRLIFIDVGLLYGSSVEDFGYDKITSLQYETGLLFGKITILASGNKAVIDKLQKIPAKQFSDLVRANIGKPKETATTVIHQAPIDVADQLQKASTAPA